MIEQMNAITGNTKTRRLWWIFVAAAAVHGLALASLIPLLQALMDPNRSLSPWVWISCGLGLATFVMSWLSVVWSYSVSVYDVCDSVVDRLGKSVVALPLGWFSKSSQAKVASAVSREVSTLSHLASLVLPALANNTVIPGVLTVATLIYDWRLGLVMAAAILPLYWAWGLMQSRAKVAQQEESDAAASSAGRLIEFASLQPLMRACGLSQRGWDRLDTALEREHDRVLNALRVKGRPSLLFTTIVEVTFMAVMALGLWLVSGQSLDWPGFVAVAVVAARSAQPLGLTPMYGAEVTNSKVALELIGSITGAQRLPEADRPADPVDTSVSFENVGFGYVPGTPVLQGVTLTAQEGEVTALVGPSGSGKSTVLRLVSRFWDVDSGRVRIGGVDVRDIPTEQLMSMISLVFQDVYLFDTTIRQNLQMARPDATEEELAAAAKAARLDRVIESLPDGWDTQVGQGGLRLSGGERQRVAIARAFIKDAPILLLDEITSALDGENEAAVAAAITELSKGRTVIVVAHRLSTIREAAQVAVIAPPPAEGGTGAGYDADSAAGAAAVPGDEAGAGRTEYVPGVGPSTVVELGTAAELEAKGGIFAGLVRDSSSGTEWKLGATPSA